jgi:hypothetical protein
MVSIGKRAAGLGAVVAIIATAGPISAADAATTPAAAPSPVVQAFQTGALAAIGGWNAGADAAVYGWNAGAAALGLPFQFKASPSGPLGLHTPGLAR